LIGANGILPAVSVSGTDSGKTIDEGAMLDWPEDWLPSDADAAAF
jgi:hypothetical protein